MVIAAVLFIFTVRLIGNGVGGHNFSLHADVPPKCSREGQRGQHHAVVHRTAEEDSRIKRSVHLIHAQAS